jgi:uncharacterized protein
MAVSFAVTFAGRLCGLAAVLGLTWAAPALAAPPAVQASFDCTHAAGAIETAICAHPDIAARDLTVAQLFALVRTDALGTGPSDELTRQRQWIGQRDKDCAKAADVAACLRLDYDGRLEELAAAALIRAPQPALAELKRQKPDAAPLYQAIYLMATSADTPSRAQSVEALIAPAFAKLAADQADMLDTIKTAHDAAASIKNFDTFIDLVAVEDGLAVTMPCEAIVKQPGLINALDSQFGSTMDGQLGASDCDVMLPPPAAFASFAAAALDKATSDPDCTGSIRYAGMRSYTEFLITAQLDRQAGGKRNAETVRETAAYERAHASATAAAIADLAAYYTQRFHTPDAAAAARKAVDQVTDMAFNACEG